MKPRKRICPRKVAADCLELAWRDEIDDRLRLTLERAHDIIEVLLELNQSMGDRLCSNAKCLEVVEAELASRRFPLLDEDDPGIAL